ncbi:Protein T19C4.1 [Aphelenchoides avenae]|nr:Protein T19C4.1 [Aphelenchus avenae]
MRKSASGGNAKATPETGKKNATKSSTAPKEKEEPKRPGSAVSREFMPKKQQNVGSAWKKHEEQQPHAQSIYGYVPFKSAPLPAIYGIRTTTPQPLNPADYMHSIYAPPQALRPDPAAARDGNQRQESRPGSEMGLYRPSSRYQSYTTLPRPEIVDIDDAHQHHFRQVPGHEIYGTTAMRGQPQAFPVKKEGPPQDKMAKIPTGRSPSALSGANPMRTSEHFPQPITGHKSLYGMPPPSAADFGYPNDAFGAEAQSESIINWYKLQTASMLHVAVGVALFAIGILRIFVHADYAKGTDVFYGVSVVTAGLVGFLGSRFRSYTMSIAAMVHAVVNTVFAFGPTAAASIQLMRLLDAANNPSAAFEGDSSALWEPYVAMALVSVLEFALALCTCVIGFKAAAALIQYVEVFRQEYLVPKNAKGIPTLH